MPGSAPTLRTGFLSTEERDHLFSITHRGLNKARTITRAWILQKLDEGMSRNETRKALGSSLPTIDQVFRRYCDEGLEAALSERPRPGQKPKLTDKQAAQICAIIGPCGCSPARWSNLAFATLSATRPRAGS